MKKLTAKEFTGKKDFKQLESLPQADRDKIVSDLDPETYLDYVNWFKTREGLEIDRGGRTIKLD